VNDQRLEITTTPIDLASSALTQVSIAPRFLTWMRDNGGFFWMSDQNRSSSGPINANLTKWSLDLQYSTGSGYSNWRNATNGNAGESLNEDIVVNARYFRLRVRGENLRQSTTNDNNERPALALLEQLEIALYRA